MAPLPTDALDDAPGRPGHVLDEPEAGGRAIRGAVLRTGGFVTGALLTLVSAPLLVRHLGVVGFGDYMTVVALVALVGGLTEAGLGPIGVREYAVLEGGLRDRFMRNLLGLRIVLTLLGAAGAVVFAMAAGYASELVLGTVVASIALLIMTTQYTYAVPLYAELHIGRQVAADLIAQTTLVAVIVALIVAGAGLVPFLGAPIVSGLVLLTLTVVFVRGRTPLRPAFEGRQWRGVLADTLPVGLATAVHSMYLRSVILIMSVTATGLETGYFATAFRITEVLILIPVLLVGTTFPVIVRAAHTDELRLGYVTRRLLETSIIGGVLIGGALAAGAGFAIDVIAPPEGDPATDVLRVQAAMLLLAFVSATLGHVLLSQRRHKEMLLASGTALVVTAGLCFVLVPALDAVGGALSAVIGETALVIVSWVALRRAQPDLRAPVSVLARVVLAGGAAAAAAVVAPVPDVAAAAIFAAVYLALVVALRIVPAEIRDALLRR